MILKINALNLQKSQILPVKGLRKKKVTRVKKPKKNLGRARKMSNQLRLASAISSKR
jgi:hypothetical protein